MATIASRPLLWFLAILLAGLSVAPSVAGQSGAQADVAYAVTDVSAQPSRQVDHASKKVRHPPSLEEFFEIDDDAEQYFKSDVLTPPVRSSFLAALCSQADFYRAAPSSHRVCAAFPTGPPSA